ncbi:Alpha/Beta hydrolase protein [Fomitopsis serialis]|uniref:Alpha/Beta hydrolase protein n=1 Tax=Fomitopsis serialis TaxID=139415 RepID=UPI0020086E8C|nr:Alpha/Beta hydrolase protein [Neoantrodia serialis]KAH9918265.1 Alpha/Beta hydrolase protein [Neoantrodia serialis]
MTSLVINDQGVELRYTDSGAPPNTSSTPYMTLFMVHGMGFTGPIFKKIQALAHSSNLRVVAINRRGYAGSTPFTPEEAAAPLTGSDEDKAAYIANRGIEIASFIDIFIQKHNIPPIAAGRKGGGVGLLGWSAGNVSTVSAVAHVGALPPEVQKRLALYMRALVMQEPPSGSLGIPLPAGTWSPGLSPSIPKKWHKSFFTQWITSYFDHGDLSTRDTDVLSYVVPSILRRPSIYSMSDDDRREFVEEVAESAIMLSTMPQALAMYRRACFDRAARAQLSELNVWFLTGDVTCSFSIAAFWAIQDDDNERGGGFVHYKMIPGVNHFMHWDDPEKAVQAYLEALA